MVEFLELRGIEGATVLEIGGGVGEIQIELLKRGAARSVNLELSSAYDEEAKRLLREAALEDRAERRLHDIAVEPDGVESADIVVLHRVVCCYPDYERLLGRRSVLGGCSCSAIPRATRCRAFSSVRRTSFSSCSGGSIGASSIRRRRCSACLASAGFGARSPITLRSGRLLGSSAARALEHLNIRLTGRPTTLAQ